MNSKTKSLVRMAVIAALYAGLTYAVLPLSFGAVQFRLSEALLILAAYSGSAVPGVALGCLLANIASPLGPIDMAVGTLATLLAAFAVHFFSRRYSSAAARALFTVLVAALLNGLLVGGEIVFLTKPADADGSVWLLSFLWVALGEIVVCGALCYPLSQLIMKNAALRSFFQSKRRVSDRETV